MKCTEWLPIDSAPKDGTAVIAFIPKPDTPGDEIDIVEWRCLCDGTGEYGWCHARCADGLGAGNPSHWMPLPEPPIS